MYKVYIVQSEIHYRYYIGHTSDLDKRLLRHNAGLVHSTKSGRPWLIIYTEIFSSKDGALKRERQIKAYKGGEAFKKLFMNKVTEVVPADSGAGNRDRLPVPPKAV